MIHHGLTLNGITFSRASCVSRNGGLSMIMVDYLQLMRAPAFSDNRTLEIAEISRSLKALAKRIRSPCCSSFSNLTVRWNNVQINVR